MTKKIIGLCLIIIGSVLFLRNSYALINHLSTPKEEDIQHTKRFYAEQGLSNYYSEESIEMLVKGNRTYQMVFLPIVMVISGGLIFGGIALFRGKNKLLREAQKS